VFGARETDVCWAPARISPTARPLDGAKTNETSPVLDFTYGERWACTSPQPASAAIVVL